MKTKISILFYASASNQLKSGLVPIYLRITVNGKRIEISTGKFIEESKWNKAANAFSSLAIRLVLLLVAVFISFMLNIGLALLVGEFLGKTYYGFFLIAGFYVLVGIVVFLFRKQWIKHPVSNFIISQSLSEK